MVNFVDGVLNLNNRTGPKRRRIHLTWPWPSFMADLEGIVGPFYSLVLEHFGRIYNFGWYLVHLENTMTNVSSTAHIGPHWSFRILIHLNHQTQNCRVSSAPLYIMSDLLPYPDLIPKSYRLMKHFHKILTKLRSARKWEWWSSEIGRESVIGKTRCPQDQNVSPYPLLVYSSKLDVNKSMISSPKKIL